MNIIAAMIGRYCLQVAGYREESVHWADEQDPDQVQVRGPGQLTVQAELQGAAAHQARVQPQHPALVGGSGIRKL